MSSWRGKRRGQSSPSDAHDQRNSDDHSASASQLKPQRQQQQPAHIPAAAFPSTAATSDNAATAGGKSILNEVLAFMQQAHQPHDTLSHDQAQRPPQQQPQQFPQPHTPAYSPPPQHGSTPHQPSLPAFQPPLPVFQPPQQPMQPPPGFSRPPPPFTAPADMQPPAPSAPPAFNPSRPPQSSSAAFGALGASPPPPRPFPAPIAPPPGFGGVRVGGSGGGAVGGGYGGLYSHFAPPPQQPAGQPLHYPHSPYAQTVDAPSMSPPRRGMPQHTQPLQHQPHHQHQQHQQQQWAESGGRTTAAGGHSDLESIAAMQRLHLDDAHTHQYQGQPPLTSPPAARPPAPANHRASPMHSASHSQQPSTHLFRTPQKQLHSPVTAAHPTSSGAAGVWARKSAGQLFGTSPASGQPQPVGSPTGPPASPLLSGNGPSTPATPSTSTPYVPYVPHPSALTQPIKPHLRRGFPSLAHVPHSSHMDQQLAALLSTLIPSSSSDASRDACRAQLEALVRRVWPTAAVRLFGSSVNLLCDERSDCDLSLLMGEETGVKQSCYNSFIPKPKKEKGKKGPDKNSVAGAEAGAETNGSAPTFVDNGQQDENDLGTAQGAAEPDAQQQQQAAAADDGSETKPPSSPQANAKQGSSLTVDMLPTLSLSNPTHLHQLSLARTSDEQQPIEPGVVIEKLAAILKTESATLYSGILALPKARVPIVKFHSNEYGYDMDIGVNNLLAIENSQLIRAYMTADVRARQLVFIVKHWAKQRKINDPFRGTLSSYAYVLMTIHFLQQLTPPVLPCLQSYGVRGRGERIVSGYDCWWDGRLASEWRSDNGSGLSALLSGWFMYYAHCYGFSEDVISVRVGGVLSKRDKEKEWAGSGKRDKHLLSIEDPFEVSHDLGRVCDGNALYEIRGETIRGTKMMMEGKSMQSIMTKYEKEWRGS